MLICNKQSYLAAIIGILVILKKGLIADIHHNLVFVLEKALVRYINLNR